MVNNDYTHWEMYAIGGSAAPTINSQGNRFLAPNDQFNKEVTTISYTSESDNIITFSSLISCLGMHKFRVGN